MFFGYISNKRGVWRDWSVDTTREGVAIKLFARNPRSRMVTTTKAFPLEKAQDGMWQRVYTLDGVTYAQAGIDFQWIDRRDI